MTTFFSNLDRYVIAGINPTDIFTEEGVIYRRKTKSGFINQKSAADEYGRVLEVLVNLPLIRHILPERAEMTLRFMKEFYAETSKGNDEATTVTNIASRMHVSQSFVYILYNKSSIFCDLFRRAVNKSEGSRGNGFWDNPITKSWQILNFIDYARKNLQN